MIFKYLSLFLLMFFYIFSSGCDDCSGFISMEDGRLYLINDPSNTPCTFTTSMSDTKITIEISDNDGCDVVQQNYNNTDYRNAGNGDYLEIDVPQHKNFTISVIIIGPCNNCDDCETPAYDSRPIFQGISGDQEAKRTNYFVRVKYLKSYCCDTFQ